MTDCEFVLDVLRDRQWHSTAELLRYSIEERGVGLTVHSRISDLRARGLNVEYRRVSGERASAHQYRLVALDEPGGTAAETPVVLPGSLSASLRRVEGPSCGDEAPSIPRSAGAPLMDVLPQGASAPAGTTDGGCNQPGFPFLQLQLDAA